MESSIQKGTIAKWLERPVLSETVLLALLCMLDLGSTIVLVKLGIAKEANPILSPYLGHSVGAFVAAKTFLSVAPLVGIEMLGWLKPGLAKLAIRAGLIGYIAVYVFGSLKIHDLL